MKGGNWKEEGTALWKQAEGQGTGLRCFRKMVGGWGGESEVV